MPMTMAIRILLTVVFGCVWWWVYNHVGAPFAYLMILGSVLAVCVCCCHPGRTTDGVWAPGQWSAQGWYTCFLRCLPNTITLIIALILIAFFVIWLPTPHVVPTMAEWSNILFAAIGAPVLVRLICCAYE